MTQRKTYIHIFQGAAIPSVKGNYSTRKVECFLGVCVCVFVARLKKCVKFS